MTVNNSETIIIPLMRSHPLGVGLVCFPPWTQTYVILAYSMAVLYVFRVFLRISASIFLLSFYKIARNWCVQSVQQLPIIIECLGIRVQRPAHPSQLCRLRKFELNSREKIVWGGNIRYSSVSGRIVPQAICPYPDE